MCKQCDKANGTNLFNVEQPKEPETPKDEITPQQINGTITIVASDPDEGTPLESPFTFTNE